MNTLRLFRVVPLLAALAGIWLARGEEPAPSRQVLKYPAAPASHASSSLLKSSAGVTYRLSLVPDLDVGNHVVVLELFLQKSAGTNGDANLLYPSGRWHGYQPFFFAASDFAHGAKKSSYGDTRVMNLPKLGITIRAKVVDVNVKPTPAGSPQELPCQFDSLTLEISTQRLAEGTTGKSAQ